MTPLFYMSTNGHSSSDDVKETLQLQTNALIQATRQSFEAMEDLLTDWLRHRRGDIEKAEEAYAKMKTAKDPEEALHIYQSFFEERSRHFAEEAVHMPGKLGSIGLKTVDAVREVGFPVPVSVPGYSAAPLVSVLQWSQMMWGPVLEMMRALPDAGKQIAERVESSFHEGSKSLAAQTGVQASGTAIRAA